jgi:hypothetical protein
VILAILVFLAIRTGAWAKFRTANPAPVSDAGSKPIKRWIFVGLILLGIWTAVKIFAGAVDLFSVPTYWDDSFNNWNMRGKIFFVSEQLELTIPNGNGYIQNAEGVSSYPPSLPLIKTWLGDLRGSWEEPVVNGVHLLWFIGLILSFYLFLRRSETKAVSVFGVYLLVSLPLMLIHGTNPYAEIFLASHLFITVSCLINASRAKDTEELTSWLKLFGLAFGLLLFTKNEATVIYAPLLILMLAWIIREKLRGNRITPKQIKILAAKVALVAACLGLPWIAFKWFNGLTFGNAKSVTATQLGFSLNVLNAIWFQLTHEANWLLLPLSIPLVIILSGKRSFRFPIGILTAFVLLAIFIQFMIFTIAVPLHAEAVNQTGLNRGLLHIAPVALLLVILLTRQLMLEPEKD